MWQMRTVLEGKFYSVIRVGANPTQARRCEFSCWCGRISLENGESQQSVENKGNKGSKKTDPNYEEVRGHVPKKLARRFKGLCTELDTDYGTALESALEWWIQQQEQQQGGNERT